MTTNNEPRIFFTPSCVGVTLIVKSGGAEVEVFITTRQLNAILAAIHIMEEED
jgi:hypothetical protein